MANPTSKKEVDSLYKTASIGMLDAVKQVSEKAKEKGLTASDVSAVVHKVFDQKVKPELQKNLDLKGPRVKNDEPEQTRKLGNK